MLSCYLFATILGLNLVQAGVIPEQNENEIESACKIGSCIAVHDCPTVSDVLSLANVLHAKKIWAQNLKCGEDENTGVPKVCCPSLKSIKKRGTLEVEPQSEDFFKEEENSCNCVQIEDCPAIFDLLSDTSDMHNQVKQQLQRIKCENDDSDVTKVCCPPEGKPITISENPTNSGECVLISECKPISDYLDNGRVPKEDMKSRIKEYGCGDENYKPKVYCPTEAEFTKVIETVQNKAKCENTEGKCNCVPINACKPIHDYLGNEPTPSRDIKELIKTYECGEGNDQIRVQCPTEHEFKKVIDMAKNKGKGSSENTVTKSNCVLITGCKSIHDYLGEKVKIGKDMEKRIKEYECGGDNDNPRVYCPTEAEFKKVIETVENESKCHDPKAECNCILISECKPIHDYLEEEPEPSVDIKKLIKKYKCGKEDAQTRVQCPTEQEFSKAVETIEDQSNESFENHEESCNCIYLDECKPIRDYFGEEAMISKDIQKRIREYECGKKNDKNKVCCPTNASFKETIKVVKNKDVELLEDLCKYANTECQTIYNQPGICKPYRQCDSVYSLLAEGLDLSLETRQDTKNMQCDAGKDGMRVCCPETKQKFRCGSYSAPTENRVIGGSNATSGQWPWMVGLYYKSIPNEYDSLLCGGSLISNQWVITAAHCQKLPNESLYYARLGSIYLRQKVPENTALEIPVAKFIKHPDYEGKNRRQPNYTNDIALVRLKTPIIEFNKFISPICVNSENESINTLLTKKILYVAGWGRTDANLGSSSSEILQYARIKFVNFTHCRQQYKMKSYYMKENSVICANDNGKDTCKGDSGGPLMIVHNRSFFLVGVVSAGFECNNKNFPGIYTNVAYYIEWINNIIMGAKK